MPEEVPDQTTLKMYAIAYMLGGIEKQAGPVVAQQVHLLLDILAHQKDVDTALAVSLEVEKSPQVVQVFEILTTQFAGFLNRVSSLKAAAQVYEIHDAIVAEAVRASVEYPDKENLRKSLRPG